MRWLRGGEDNSASAGVISAGLAEIDGLFRPSRHKQTEHVEQMKRKRADLAAATGTGAPDLSASVAAIQSHKHKRKRGEPVDAATPGNEAPARKSRQSRQAEAVRKAREATAVRMARKELASRRAREVRGADTSG
jgi:hypothetical protein